MYFLDIFNNKTTQFPRFCFPFSCYPLPFFFPQSQQNFKPNLPTLVYSFYHASSTKLSLYHLWFSELVWFSNLFLLHQSNFHVNFVWALFLIGTTTLNHRTAQGWIELTISGNILHGHYIFIYRNLDMLFRP